MKKRFKTLISEIFDSRPISLRKKVVDPNFVHYVGLINEFNDLEIQFFTNSTTSNKSDKKTVLSIAFYVSGMSKKRNLDKKISMEESNVNLIFSTIIAAMKDFRKTYKDLYNTADFVNFSGDLREMPSKEKLYVRFAKNIYKIWPEFSPNPSISKTPESRLVSDRPYRISVLIPRKGKENEI